jgi:hypothetical protein
VSLEPPDAQTVTPSRGRWAAVLLLLVVALVWWIVDRAARPPPPPAVTAPVPAAQSTGLPTPTKNP